MKKELNLITYCVIWIAIVANIVFSSKELLSFMIDNDSFHIYNMAVHIIGIYTLYLIVEKLKQSGFWMFLILNLINSFVIGGINNDYFPHFFAAIVYIGILYGILCLKKNNVSGWNLLESNNKKTEKTKDE